MFGGFSAGDVEEKGAEQILLGASETRPPPPWATQAVGQRRNEEA